MKLLTITVPCYNSQDHMKKCIDSLLIGGEETEIIIIDDGSTDNTLQIAQNYAKEYPNIVKVIHQENGGQGAALNTGLAHATGIYFKVVGSDDWVDEDAYRKILSTLESLVGGNCALDMLISNFTYEKEGAKRRKVVRYTNILPENQIFGWNETKHFNMGKYILMHSVIYRTKLLRECHLVLPRHTSYVDHLFVYIPLPYVNNMYYLNVDFYRYHVGSEDQSVNEQVMISQVDQLLRVNKIMIDAYDFKWIQNLHLRNYMFSYLNLVTSISTVMLIHSGTRENQEKKRDFWKYIYNRDKRLYMKLRNRISGQTLHLPGKGGRQITMTIYKITQKFLGL